MTRDHAAELRELIVNGPADDASIHATVIMALGYCWGWVASEKANTCPRCYREAEDLLYRIAKHFGVSYEESH